MWSPPVVGSAARRRELFALMRFRAYLRINTHLPRIPPRLILCCESACVMGDNLDEVSAEIAPPQKRSLFKKPTWTKPKDAGGDSVEFFSRAKEVFPLQIAEDEHRRRKKLEKLDRKRSTESAEKNASRTPELKKRRISSQADEHTPERSPNQENHDNRTRRYVLLLQMYLMFII
jgi:hypothetical protein